MLLQITVFINESKEETEPCTEEGVVVVAVGGVADKNTKRNTHAEDERREIVFIQVLLMRAEREARLEHTAKHLHRVLQVGTGLGLTLISLQLKWKLSGLVQRLL